MQMTPGLELHSDPPNKTKQAQPRAVGNPGITIPKVRRLLTAQGSLDSADYSHKDACKTKPVVLQCSLNLAIPAVSDFTEE